MAKQLTAVHQPSQQIWRISTLDVFVDDDPENVRAAPGFGVRVFRLRHRQAQRDPSVEELNDLRQPIQHL